MVDNMVGVPSNKIRDRMDCLANLVCGGRWSCQTRVAAVFVAVLFAGTALLNCRKKNQTPDAPSVPAGPASGYVDSVLTFTSSAADPDGDSVAIRFSWGDGDTSAWSDWLASGGSASDTHACSAPGTYVVRAQAKDIAGVQSAWSASCTVHVTRIVSVGWTRTYGGDNYDDGFSVQQTSDGGYIITGSTSSYGTGNADVWLIRTDPAGDTLWTKTFGGTEYDGGASVQQTSDGGYIIAAWTYSFGAGGCDVWLIKTDASGNQSWAKTFGGTSGGHCYSVQQTADGGYIVAGSTVSEGPTWVDVWLIKTDAVGDTLWTKTFGGEGADDGYSVQQTSDGGYIVAGYYNLRDAWLIKTDADGDTLWTRTFGGFESSVGNSVQQTSDGGYIIAGNAQQPEGSGGFDILLIKTDASGNQVWSRTYGASYVDIGWSAQQTTDGGYIITGSTWPRGDDDVWLIKTNASGDTVWTRTFGWAGEDEGRSVQQTSDGGYVVTGSAWPPGAGNGEVWLIKTDANGDTIAP